MTIHCRYDELVEPNALKPHPKNANKHPEDQIERLAKILNYQGWRYPIKVSRRSGFVTSGHGRILAAKHLGWDKIPVNYQDYEDEDQETADVHSDNSIAAWAELDLSLINAQMGDFDPGFDLDLLGIKDFVLDMSEKDFGSGEDEVPEAPPEPVVKRGELWILGEHRLLIDDCTVKENVERLMNGEKADMVFTDPPYNHASENDLVAANLRPKSFGKLKNSEWDKNFAIYPALEKIEDSLSTNASVYIFTSHHLAGEIWEWMNQVKNVGHVGSCVWHKPNPMPSLMKRHWTWSTELICYMTRGKHVFNFPESGHALNLWIHNKENKENFVGHPTQKPVNVCLMGIEKSSNPNQLVFDPFLGSGSTLIACEKTNRRCFGCEIDPTYGQVILERWQKFSGKKAVREDGKTLEDLKGGK